MSASLLNPSEECLASVYKDLGTSWNQVDQDVRMLMTWLDQQPHLPHIMEKKTVLSMYVRCKCSMERTKRALDMHYTLKTAVPEFFADRDPMSPRMQNMMDMIWIASLPQPTKTGYRVAVFKFTDRDIQQYTTEECLKYALMIADIRAKHDRCVGDIYILDYEHLQLGHVTKVTLPIVKKLEAVCTKGFSTRVKGLHFLNAPPVFDLLLKLLKSALKPKIAARVHVHADLESLYEHVDRHVLPLDYGGEDKKLEEIARDWRGDVERQRDWFISQEALERVDESKRPDKLSVNVSDIFGFEGTFKKLSVD